MSEPTLDEMFRDFARAFMGEVTSDRDVAFPHKLPRQELDFSLKSLLLVDDYLDYLYRHRRKIADLNWNTTILRGGAYVGEVIRCKAPSGYYHWMDYNEYMPQHPDLQSLIPERTAATCAFLVSDHTMIMPLNKVARYLDEGVGNSVFFFADYYSSCMNRD